MVGRFPTFIEPTEIMTVGHRVNGPMARWRTHSAISSHWARKILGQLSHGPVVQGSRAHLNLWKGIIHIPDLDGPACHPLAHTPYIQQEKRKAGRVRKGVGSIARRMAVRCSGRLVLLISSQRATYDDMMSPLPIGCRRVFCSPTPRYLKKKKSSNLLLTLCLFRYIPYPDNLTVIHAIPSQSLHTL